MAVIIGVPPVGKVSDLRSMLVEAAAADPLHALVAANGIGKVIYRGADAYDLYALDLTTPICTVHATYTTANVFTVHRIDYGSTQASPKTEKGTALLLAAMKSAFAVEPVHAAIAAGNFGAVVFNGNNTYTVQASDGKSNLAKFTAGRDTAGHFTNFTLMLSHK